MITVSVFKNWCVIHDQFCIFGRIDSDSTILNRNFNVDDTCHINSFLKNIFGTHRKFYDALKHKGYHEVYDYHPCDNNFDNNCDGFSKFVNDNYGKSSLDEIGENKLKEIGDLAVLEIKKYLSKFGQKNKTIYSSKVLFPDDKDYEDFNDRHVADPQFLNDSLFVTDKGVFSVNLIKTKYNSLEDIQKSVIQMVNTSFDIQLNAKISVYEEEIEKLKKDIEDIKDKSFKEGLNLSEDIKEDWILEGGYLIYKKPIYVKRAKYKDKIYTLEVDYEKIKERLEKEEKDISGSVEEDDEEDDEEYEEYKYKDLDKKYFITGLEIDIERTINDASCSNFHHPNANDGDVCIGDLKGKRISEVLKKIVPMLETASIDSSFDNSATDEIIDLIENGILKESGNIWGGDVWKT